MISCRELAALLGDYVSDDLPSERRDHVDKHMTHCSHCAAYFQSYVTVIQLTRRLPPAPLPQGLAQRFTQALGNQQR
jgi:anti-sigma factor RsiW